MHKRIDITLADLKELREARAKRLKGAVLFPEIASDVLGDIIALIDEAWVNGNKDREEVRIGTLHFFTDEKRHLHMEFESRFPIRETGEGDEEEAKIRELFQRMSSN